MVDPNETRAGTGAPDGPGQWSGQWRVGTLVGDGRYRLTGKLGRGGMAEVFAAEDLRLGRIVAVKLLRTDLAEDPVSKARFTREAQSVAGLNHHAVVAVYDSGEDSTDTGTVPYIVMELVEGHTIKDLLSGPTPPPVDQALLIVSGVLEALAYSHQHGIVHRDIKPANVIITTTGAVKVMDFGIARALHGAASTMTQTGMVMGTPQYLSPEQALGKTVDHRSDLYATGCLLYELLALRPPFTGESPLSVVYQHVQDDPWPPSEVNDRVPPELDGLVLQALAKQPEDRFQSAEQMGGVVGYAHQALTEQGGWTGGLWNTGVVPAPGAAARTAPTAMAPAGTGPGAGRHTAEFGAPLLAGIGGIGGDDVHGYDAPPPSGGGNRWVKPVLFAVAAVLAIALGIFLATRGTGGGHTPADRTTTPPAATQDTGGQPNDQPTDEQPSDSGEVSTGPQDTATSTGKPTMAPTTTAPATHTGKPTDTATQTPTGKPSDTETPPPTTPGKPPTTPADPPTGGTGTTGGPGGGSSAGIGGGPGSKG